MSILSENLNLLADSKKSLGSEYLDIQNNSSDAKLNYSFLDGFDISEINGYGQGLGVVAEKLKQDIKINSGAAENLEPNLNKWYNALSAVAFGALSLAFLHPRFRNLASEARGQGKIYSDKEFLPISDTKIRSFQFTSKEDSSLTAILAGELGASNLRVQEITRQGLSGPLNLHVQHAESWNPVKTISDNTDLIASCAISSELLSKSVFPGHAGELYMGFSQGKGQLNDLSFLRFALRKTDLEGSTLPANYYTPEQVVKLERPLRFSVAQVLTEARGVSEFGHLLHNPRALASAMRDFDIASTGKMHLGLDSVSIELVTGDWLKLTRSFESDFGTRSYKAANGKDIAFDAPIVSGYAPQEKWIGDTKYGEHNRFYYFVQAKAADGVTPFDLATFKKNVESSGYYKFWDLGTDQVGYRLDAAGVKRVVLRDYRAVLPKAEVPAKFIHY